MREQTTKVITGAKRVKLLVVFFKLSNVISFMQHDHVLKKLNSLNFNEKKTTFI